MLQNIKILLFISFNTCMNVQNINNNNQNFKSGLTHKIIKDIRKINVPEAELEFTKLGIDADFKGSKTICANFVLVSNILKDISEKYKLPFDYNPPAIRVYKDKDLSDNIDARIPAFCNHNTMSILKEEPPFVGGSIFVNKKYNGLIRNDIISNLDYLVNWISSSHFLSRTMHEWFHCIHANIIYKDAGYEGECPILREKYYKEVAKGLSKINILTNLPSLPDSDILAKIIGKYAAYSCSMLEVFAELMTKMTVKSLDKDLNVIKNPLDNIPKELPAFYKKEIEKILNI